MSDYLHPMFGSPVAPWHRWFAWRPVDTADRGYVWLRVIWRRRIQKKLHLDGPIDLWWQYAVEAER